MSFLSWFFSRLKQHNSVDWVVCASAKLTCVLLIPSSRRRVTSACLSNSVWATRSSCSAWGHRTRWMDRKNTKPVLLVSPPLTPHAGKIFPRVLRCSGGHDVYSLCPPPQSTAGRAHGRRGRKRETHSDVTMETDIDWGLHHNGLLSILYDVTMVTRIHTHTHSENNKISNILRLEHCSYHSHHNKHSITCYCDKQRCVFTETVAVPWGILMTQQRGPPQPL